jgi:MoaA/NifB/PqqE/SkfB family radical SAM enzyme
VRLLPLAVSIAKNRAGAVPRPSWCTYLVSYRCNARCGMCDSWRLKPGPELTPTEVGTVFGKIGRLDVVRLTGGEPFLRGDLGAIAETVMERSRPSVLHITTNGSRPDAIEAFARSFSQPKRLRFLVSLDGLADEHDQSRGEDATFAAALESVRRLTGARRDRGIDVAVNHTVISARSVEDHAELLTQMEALDVDVQSVLAYADSSMYGLKLRGKKAEHLIVPRGYPLHPKLRSADVIGFVEGELARVSKLRSRTTRIGKRYYLNGLLSRLKGDPDPSPKPPCVALRSHIRLLPDGRVPVCQFNTETVGNLLTSSFDEVWGGAPATESRRWVDACPGCWAECEVMPSALYTADIARFPFDGAAAAPPSSKALTSAPRMSERLVK